MSMAYIREHYGVPAKRGMRVVVDGKSGTITSASGHRLRVRFDSTGQVVPVHPTWNVHYPPEADR